MATIKIEIISQPSRSKGWSRYSLKQGATRIIESRTGNEWVSADHEGQAEGDATLTMQVCLREGRNNKETVYPKTVTLRPADGTVSEIEHRPGSQGMRLRITGAEVVA